MTAPRSKFKKRTAVLVVAAVLKLTSLIFRAERITATEADVPTFPQVVTSDRFQPGYIQPGFDGVDFPEPPDMSNFEVN